MGLGKTGTILKGVEPLLNKGLNLLVVCPASLKLNWCKEIKMWLGYTVKPDRYTGQITVTNYERLKNALPYAQAGRFGVVIYDEAHYLKNRNSQRYYYANECAKDIFYRFLLTGTPMVSGPCDLAAELNVMGVLDEYFGGFDSFLKRYCSPTFNGYGWDYSGSSNQTELQKKLSKYMIRRTKKECGLRLPKKTIINVPVATCPQPYADTFQEIERETREVNRVKWDFAVQTIINLEAWERWPVIFVHHKCLMDKLRKRFEGRCAAIYGGQTMYEREEAVRKFQNGEANMIICSLQASATGITLTRSNTAVFLEYLWSPAISEQAQDRIHRLSQTEDVTIYNLYCPESIEMQKDIRMYVKKLDMEGIL
jgi:SWI/SNF-related matrix-associated actin-dependent regulator 1 of chromatin subfamily A